MTNQEMEMLKSTVEALAACKRHHAEDLLSSATFDERMAQLLGNLIETNKQSNPNEEVHILKPEQEQLKETGKVIHANIEVTGDFVQGNKSITSNKQNQVNKWKELLRTMFT